MTELELFSSSPKSNKKTEDTNKNGLVEISNRKRSCTAVNIPAACVNKAVNHIQDLEVTLEKFFQQYEYLYELESLPWDLLAIKNVEESEDAFTELKTEHSLNWKDIQPLKQKTITVVAEITELITRLENERKEAEEALEFEKQRRRKLYLNSEKISLWRLQYLPKAVQKEWEKSVQDVAELQWHFEEKNEELQEALSQLAKIDVANATIQKQIDYLKKHSPLLEEKLFSEDAIINEVKMLLVKAKEAYNIVHEKYLETQSFHKELKEECKKKRIYMTEQIEADEFLLKSLMDQIKEIDMFDADFNNKINETKEQILQNENILEELIKQDTNVKHDLTTWNDKVKRLNLKISTLEDESKQMLDEYCTEKKNVEDSKCSNDSDIQNLKDKCMSALRQVSFLQSESRSLKHENGGFMQKFRDSIKKKVACQSEIQVLQKNIRRLEDHLKKVSKELIEIDLAYSEAKSKLEEMDQSIVKEKSQFQGIEDNIKKEIRGEINTWKLTQKKIKTLEKMLNKKIADHEKLQQKVKSKLEKLELLSAEESKVLAKNTKSHEQLLKKISSLTLKIKEHDEKDNNEKNRLENMKIYCLNLATEKQEKYLDLLSQYTNVNEEMVNAQKEIAELCILYKRQESQIVTIEKSVIILREKYSKRKSREENVQRLYNFFHVRLNAVEKQAKTDSRVFEELLWNREEDLKIKKIDFINLLDENLRLAREYQMLQICYLDDKSQLMDYCEHNIRADTALYDQQQLCRLQKKLHTMFLEYFKLRALCNQVGLEKFQAASNEIVQKISVVKRGLSETLQNTSTFLKSLTDGSST